MHGGLGVGHERVDVAFRLDDRAHVMMVAKLEALVGQSLGELGHLGAVSGPVTFMQPRALGQRLRPVAVNGVRRLGHDNDVGPCALGHGDMGFRRLELIARGTLEQFGRVPAANEGQAELGKLILERGAVAGQLVPLLHADDARFFCLGETCVQRRVAADFLQVVVGPADRVGADANAHFSLRPAAASSPPHSRDARRRPPSARRSPARRRPTRSRRRRSIPWDRFR